MTIAELHIYCERKKLRSVEAFTIQCLQHGTTVIPPAKLPIYEQKNVQTTLFRKYFLRGDIPIGRAYDKKTKLGTFLMWKVPPKMLDYAYYLPLFFDGLSENKFPYKEMARSGVNDMLCHGPEKILPIIPQLILPMKKALNTKNPDIIMAVLKAIQHLLVTDPCVGQALVPYYRQLLPIFHLFRQKNTPLGAAIDETLQMLEKHGGPDAFINIKYMVPTYESCICN